MELADRYLSRDLCLEINKGTEVVLSVIVPCSINHRVVHVTRHVKLTFEGKTTKIRFACNDGWYPCEPKGVHTTDITSSLLTEMVADFYGCGFVNGRITEMGIGHCLIGDRYGQYVTGFYPNDDGTAVYVSFIEIDED